MDYTKRIPIAQNLLDGYAKAKLVTTNRVHVMLPCLAFGTEVNFIVKKNNDPRLVGILELIDDKELLKSTIKGIEEDFKKRFMEKVIKYYS
jgi:ArsR family metal-binding transcriptional regulator